MPSDNLNSSNQSANKINAAPSLDESGTKQALDKASATMKTSVETADLNDQVQKSSFMDKVKSGLGTTWKIISAPVEIPADLAARAAAGLGAGETTQSVVRWAARVGMLGLYAWGAWKLAGILNYQDFIRRHLFGGAIDSAANSVTPTNTITTPGSVVTPPGPGTFPPINPNYQNMPIPDPTLGNTGT